MYKLMRSSANVKSNVIWFYYIYAFLPSGNFGFYLNIFILVIDHLPGSVVGVGLLIDFIFSGGWSKISPSLFI